MKQIVHFNEVIHCKVGGHALVHPIDHPSDLISNETWANTSQVIAVDADEFGLVQSFETKNTKYVRQ